MRHKARQFVVAYWTRTHEDMESNPGQIKTVFFHAAVMLLFYITKNYYNKVLYFPKIETIYHCMALLQVALLSVPRHKFVRPSFWYYRFIKLKSTILD
jgi:hypothetical protein